RAKSVADYTRAYTCQLRSPLLRYQPPIFGGRRFQPSAGQIVLIAVLALLFLIIYSGTGDPGRLLASAQVLAVLLPLLLVSLTLHEFAHAALAKGLGDDTAQRQGRL